MDDDFIEIVSELESWISNENMALSLPPNQRRNFPHWDLSDRASYYLDLYLGYLNHRYEAEIDFSKYNSKDVDRFYHAVEIIHPRQNTGLEIPLFNEQINHMEDEKEEEEFLNADELLEIMELNYKNSLVKMSPVQIDGLKKIIKFHLDNELNLDSLDMTLSYYSIILTNMDVEATLAAAAAFHESNPGLYNLFLSKYVPPEYHNGMESHFRKAFLYIRGIGVPRIFNCIGERDSIYLGEFHYYLDGGNKICDYVNLYRTTYHDRNPKFSRTKIITKSVYDLLFKAMLIK